MKSRLLSLLLILPFILGFVVFSGNNTAWAALPKFVDVIDYGAKGNGITNDTTAIQNAINDMTEGSALVVPPGNYKIDRIIYNPPHHCTWINYGKFISKGSAGAAITIGDENKELSGYNIQGLYLTTDPAWTDKLDWSKGRIGVRVVNIHNAYVQFSEVRGYAVNIQFEGINNRGVAYNEFHLGRIVNGKKGMLVTNSKGGWCNENSFYTGNFSFDGDVWNTLTTKQRSELLYLEITPKNDDLRFYSPCFEGYQIKAATVNGSELLFMHPRLEDVGNFTLTADSHNCKLITAFGTAEKYEDLGNRNMFINWDKIIFGNGTGILFGGDFPGGTPNGNVTAGTGSILMDWAGKVWIKTDSGNAGWRHID